MNFEFEFWNMCGKCVEMGGWGKGGKGEREGGVGVEGGVG